MSDYKALATIIFRVFGVGDWVCGFVLALQLAHVSLYRTERAYCRYSLRSYLPLLRSAPYRPQQAFSRSSGQGLSQD